MAEVIHMTIKKWLYDTRIIFTLLQALAILALAAGTLLMVWLDILGVSALLRGLFDTRGDLIPFSIIGLLTVAFISVMCYIALISFFKLCGRLKTGTAFTVQNTHAMKRIALCSLSVGAAFLLSDALICLTSFMLFDPNFHLIDVYFVGISLVFFLIFLVVWTLYLLLDRATAIQQENDLTI